MSLLELHNVQVGHVTRSTTKILQTDIEFTLEPGEILCLMGQNGVGKTTLMKTIAGLHPAIDGTLRVQDEILTTIPQESLARQLSIVLTERPYLRNISVLEFLSMGRHPYTNWLGTLQKEDERIIEQVLGDTRINYIANQSLHELSDGQFQKAMIARALVQQTPLIILDEPVAHLDLNGKLEIMRLLRSIARQGKGIIFSSHDLAIATQFADRILLLDFNQPPLQGIPEDLILDNSMTRYLHLEDHQLNLRDQTITFEARAGLQVDVLGEGDIAYWTRRALERKGFELDPNATLSVICTNTRLWKTNWDSEDTFDRLEQLIVHLAHATQPS